MLNNKKIILEVLIEISIDVFSLMNRILIPDDITVITC